MAIPGPGPSISMTTLNTEFGGGFALSSYYRGGTYVPNSPINAAIPTSGAIALGNFYGSSNRVPISLTASGNNYDVYANRGPTYVAGVSDLTITVPGTVGSTSTGAYAMLVPSSFSPTDTVTIVNNGVIQGMGGAGGAGGNYNNVPGATGGGAGGYALYVNRPTTITNNGTIAGGGGGGGGGGGVESSPNSPSPFLRPIRASGGGGGGGAGTNGGSAGAAYTLPPYAYDQYNGSPGADGSSAGGGGGGAGGSGGTGPQPGTLATGGTGGAGGGRGAVGAGGGASVVTGRPAPQPSNPGAAGGGAGYYLVGNAFVTWPAVGTRQGNVA